MGTVYAVPGDLADLGINPNLLARFSEARLQAQLLAASDEASSYLASAFTLPLTAWGAALRRHVCMMAVHGILHLGGMDPEAKEYEVIRDGYRDALRWLEKVASRTIALLPPDYVDSGAMTARHERRGPFVVHPRYDMETGTTVSVRPRGRGWTY